MSQNFDNKDYSGYFSEIERSLEGKANKPQKIQVSSKNTASVSKKIPGAVISFKKLRPWVKVSAVLLVLVLLGVVIFTPRSSKAKAPKVFQQTENNVETERPAKNLKAKADDKTVKIGDEFAVNNIVFIDIEENRIVAQKNSGERCYPASTTKIMTLLVASEMIKDFDDTFKMTYEITDPLYRDNATVAGFLAGEEINMMDLLYGTILPSGADATIGLAIKLCGSEENFVKEMNKKAKELGLKNTNFKN